MDGHGFQLPSLYAIVDAELTRCSGLQLAEVASQLAAAGVQLLQYRDKAGSSQEILCATEIIDRSFSRADQTKILNDYAELVMRSGWDGVHIGQADMSLGAARESVGAERIVGVSTHTDEQVRRAAATDADYIAIGPVFGTTSKADPEPTIGLEGVRRARSLTSKPLVAIGGISAQNARAVMHAGADSVAVISALLPPDGAIERNARWMLRQVS